MKVFDLIVYGTDVIGQVDFLRERTATKVAFVVLNFVMDRLDVVFQMDLLAKRIIAL